MDNKAVSFCSEILFITYTSRLLCMRWGIRIQGNSLEIRSALLNVISQTTALFPFVTSILFFFFSPLSPRSVWLPIIPRLNCFV